MATERCPRCDRPGCERDQWADPWDAETRSIAADCAAHEVTREQWRSRALTAEARADRLRAAVDGACQAIEAIAAMERVHPAIGIIARDLRAALREQP